MKSDKTYISPAIEICEVRVEAGFAASDFGEPGSTGSTDYDSNDDHIDF